jgi:hypothetical protein
MLTDERIATMEVSKHKTNRSRSRTGKFSTNRRALLTLLAGGAGGILISGGATWIISSSAQTVDESKKVTLYKDPQCSCCEGYADYLRGKGFHVSIVPTHDLPLLDEKYGIATDLSPCHISMIGGYVVGGHVPIEIVDRLLSEKPAITGITLPGMPLGSPGMSGQKTAPFTIYEIAKGSRQFYAVV